MQKLSTIANFSSVVTNCLIEPLKIIVNFGENRFENFVGKTIFDADIKVYIDDETERNKSVGWNCGFKETRYLKWNKDSRYGEEPEYVFVDVDSYKWYNPNKTTLDIITNVCWFAETNIMNENIIVNVVWKGFFFAIPITDIQYNIGCCNNTVVKIHIDLTTDTVTPSYPVYYFVEQEYLLNNHLYGYIKTFQTAESDLKQLNENNNKLKINLSETYDTLDEVMSEIKRKKETHIKNNPNARIITYQKGWQQIKKVNKNEYKIINKIQVVE